MKSPWNHHEITMKSTHLEVSPHQERQRRCPAWDGTSRVFRGRTKRDVTWGYYWNIYVTHIYIYVYMCLYLFIYTCIYIYMCIHIYIHTYVCMSANIYIYIYKYTHTHPTLFEIWVPESAIPKIQRFTIISDLNMPGIGGYTQFSDTR